MAQPSSIIAIAMQKGGTGKTTTVVNLAAALAERGLRVLVLDLDPQANCSMWLDVATNGPGIYACLCDDVSIERMCCSTPFANLDVVPSSSWLADAERRLFHSTDAPYRLKRALSSLTTHYDIVLIDTPPATGALTVNALVASQWLLLPVEASILALTGLSQSLATFGAIEEQLNHRLQILGVVACRVRVRTRHAHEVMAELRRRLPSALFQSFIRENVRIAESPSYRRPVLLHDTCCHGSEDYRQLADELLTRLNSEVHNVE